jgi:flagellar hook-length control protein FliK
MKVPSDPAGSAPPPSRSSEPTASESKPFDKVLERKSGEGKAKKKGEEPGGKGLEGEGKSSLAMSSAPWLSMRDGTLSATAKAGAAPEIRDLDGLVQEITAVAGPGTDPKVEIQFHSKTLEGLNVQIAKKGDEISIRFLTASDSVAQLLSKNSDQLSQALEAKGIHVAPIQVSLAPTAPRFTDSSSSSRDGRRGRGDERQQRQKK